MGGKSPPSSPNPEQVANAQTSSNVGTAIANTMMGNADVHGPLGNTNYQVQNTKRIKIGNQHYDIPIYNVKQTLSRDQQALLDAQESMGINLGELGADQARKMQNYLGQRIHPNQLPDDVRNAVGAQHLDAANSPEDFVAEKHRTEEALMARLNPQLDRDRASAETRLANQGVGLGSEAYNRKMDEFNRSSTDARMQAILSVGQEQDRLYGLEMQRVNQLNQIRQNNFENRRTEQQDQGTIRERALQEQIALRNQPLSEIAALLHGSSPTIPQFTQFQAGKISDTPVGQYMYQSAALDNQAYAQQMAQQSSMMGGLFGMGSNLLMLSDRTAKENIKKVGKLDNKLPIFSYNYKGDPTPRIGLMAQDVEKVHPEAIGRIGSFKAVDYGKAVQPVEA